MDPLRVSHETVTLFAICEGSLDQLAVERVVPFLGRLRQRMDEADADVLAAIEREDAISPATRDRLRDTLESLQRTFSGNASP